MGWFGVLSSASMIVFGVMLFSVKSRTIPLMMAATAIIGIFASGSLTAIAIGIALLGAVLSLFGTYEETEISETSKSKLKYIIPGGFVAILLSGMMYTSSEDKPKEPPFVLANAEVTGITPYGELQQAFEFGGNYTDVQRNNLKKEVMGSVVVWTLPVYNVKKTEDGYRIRTSSVGIVGTEFNLKANSPEEERYIESLMTGSTIRVKGVISGIDSLRTVKLSPAMLYSEPLRETSQIIEEEPEDVVQESSEQVIDTAELEVGDNTESEPEHSPTEQIGVTIMEADPNALDCSKAKDAVQALICNNINLGEIQEAMRQAYPGVHQ